MPLSLFIPQEEILARAIELLNALEAEVCVIDLLYLPIICRERRGVAQEPLTATPFVRMYYR